MSYDSLKNTKPPAQKTMNKTVVRYDVHGAVAHVLRKAEQHVPHVFPHMPAGFLITLKQTIKKHAAHHGWQNIALSLSQGLAREELDDLVAREIAHIGPIVVDATGSTPEHQTFDNGKLVKVNMERLVMMNEAMNDVLIIIYGLESVDENTSRQLLIKRLRMTGNTLEMLRENFEWMDDQRDNPNKLMSKLERTLKMVRENLGKLLLYVTAALKADQAPDNTALAQAEAFIMLVHLREALQHATDPQLRQTFENISMQLRHIPENFRDLDFTYGPYERMANDLVQERLQAKPVIAPPPPPKPAMNPHIYDYAPRPS